ncbi:MarR family transcriptional regulator, partial [Ruegeria sp. NA]
AALETIRAEPGIDQATVAAKIAYDRATIGGVIDRLEQKNYVRRSVSQRDRRAREVTLSEKGKDILAAAMPVVIDLQNEILEGLTPNERVTFLKLAGKAVEAVTDDNT